MPGYDKLLNKKGFQSVLSAYQKQMEYWADAYLEPEELFQQRRAFVNAYRDELNEMGEYLFADPDRQIDRLMTAKNDGILEMMKDFQYLKLDEEIERARSGVESERKTERLSKANTEKAEFRSRLMVAGLETSAALDKRQAMSGTSGDALSDPTLTDAQRNGLRDFHQWLYRNCDKSGFEVFGSAGSIRAFANEFVKKPVDVQLKTLYLLETNRRKLGSGKQTLDDDINSQTTYAPNLDKIKDRLIATRLKFWRRTDGSQFYWNKLTESLKQAEERSEMTGSLRSAVKDEYQKSKDLSAFRNVQNEAYQTYVKQEPNVKGSSWTLTAKETVGPTTKTVNEVSGQYKNVTSVNGLIKGIAKIAEASKNISAENFLNDVKDNLPKIQDDLVGVKKQTSLFAQEGTVLGVVAIASGVGSLGAGIIKGVNLANTHGVTRTTANLKQGVDLIGDAGKIVKSVSTSVAGLAEKGSAAATGASSAAGIAGAAGFGVAAISNGLEIIEKSKNLNHLKKADAEIKKLSPEYSEEKKQLKTDSKVLRHLNEAAKKSAVKDAKVNASCVALSAAGLAVPGLAVLTTPTVAAIQVGHRIKSSFDGAKQRRNNVQMVTEQLGDDQRKTKTKVADYENKLQTKASLYPQGSAEYHRIRKYAADPKRKSKALYQVDQKTAVKHGSEHMTAYAEKKLDKMAERLIRNVYLVDPKGGMTADNLLTKDQLKGNNMNESKDKKVRRISFNELFKGTGGKVKAVDHKKEKNVEKALKERQADLKKKMVGMMKKG